MSGRAFIDCTASFNLRSSTFPCELPYLHEGEHQTTLKGEEFRIVFYGNFTRADAETVLRWKPAHDDYTYTELRPGRTHPPTLTPNDTERSGE